MKIIAIIKLANKFYKLAEPEIDILYLVHPNSILEQTQDIKYIKPWIDEWRSAVNSFNGIVIASSLVRGKVRPKGHYLEYSRPGPNDLENIIGDDAISNRKREGIKLVNEFMEELSNASNVFVFEENDSSGNSTLGGPAMKEKIDDLFLEDRLGKIIVGGCFICSYATMCVAHTLDNLNKNYPDKVEVNRLLTIQAGVVIVDEEGNIIEDPNTKLPEPKKWFHEPPVSDHLRRYTRS